MNNLFRVFVFISIFLHVNGDLFDRYSGKKFDEQRTKELRLKKYVDKCAIDIKTCAAHEVSRVTGTCNNYNLPAAGAAGRPYLRLLDPEYANQYEIRKSKDGDPLPSARTVSEMLTPTKHIQEMKQQLSAAAFHFIELIRKDVSVMKDSYYLKGHDCCSSKEEQDPHCIPIHDENRSVKGMNCFNFSRAETFQDLGCTHDVTPTQVNYQTPLLDLSIVYGVDEESLKSVRLYENGLLKTELRGNRHLPMKVNETDCYQPKSQMCYEIGLPKVTSVDVRTTALVIFFIREHNRLAGILRELNPCWKDDRLFKVARQINIATASNIFLYELMPKLLGYSNMMTYDLISSYAEHVSAYDAQSEPGVFVEFDTALRFFKTVLDKKIVKYNEKYENVGEDELADVPQSLLEIGTKFDEVIRGVFVQTAGLGQGNEQAPSNSSDQISLHVQRGRDLGIRGYNEYRSLCGLKSAKDFHDLLDVIDGERVAKLKSLYKTVGDIDLLVGMISENNIDGTFVGPTLFCIIVKQLQIFRFSDRFWFERGDNYHSFSLSQLREIRRTNMARLACDNAETIKFIQPYAMLTVTPWNSPTPCSEISGPNFEEWRDASCKENSLIDSTKSISNYPKFSPWFNNILSSMHL